MNSPLNNQIQVYHHLIKHSNGQIIEYAQLETRVFNLNQSPELMSPAYHPPVSSSYEFSLAMFLIILLPIFMCVSYRYGKRIGKMENNFVFTNGDSALIRKRRLSSQLIPEAPIEVLEGERALLPVQSSESSLHGKSDFDDEDQICQRKFSQKLESSIKEKEVKKDQCLKEESELSKSEPIDQTVLAIENKQSSQRSEESAFSACSPKEDVNDDLKEFQIVLKQSYDKESQPQTINYDCEEKLKLHTDSNQVKKKEVKFGLSFENRNGTLEKVETIETRIIYSEDAQEVKKNALLFQKTYESYKTLSLSDKPLLALTDSKETLQRSNSAGTCPTIQTLPSTTVTDLMTQVINPDKVIKPISLISQTTQAISKTHFGKDIQTLLENDDLPHETGKFNKIFKDAEVIGEGSFGEVYKVVHKLDGKIYAVKKVKLRLARIEDLQKKSKVFREVFAMTDLHHPNIVRYSTCWVELEKKEQSQLSLIKKDKLLAIQSESSIVFDEESKPEASKSVGECIRTSSIGFEWDLGEDESPSAKLLDRSPKEKLALTYIKDPSVMTDSMSKTSLKGDLEESSPISAISKSEYSEHFSGHKLYLYIQMEYCSGQNLRNYLDMPERKVYPLKVLQMFRKILEGVNTIHKRGILHRDLKPANIFLDENENIKIGDFGLASLDHTEESKDSHHHHHHHHNHKTDLLNVERSLSKTVGTPMYSSPEQESGGRYNQKTDVYSLGFILCEMLAGLSTHHERYQLFNLLRKNHQLPPQFRLNHPKEGELILKMTAFSPEERPNTEEIIVRIDKLIKESNTNQKED